MLKFCLIYNFLNVYVNNLFISNLVEMKNNSKYFIEYLDKTIRPLVLILPIMSGYVKTFKVKDGENDKSNKLMSFCIIDEMLLEKHKTISTKIEDVKNLKLNVYQFMMTEK